MASMTDVGDPGRVRALDAVTTRVRAPNPSPMTLTGTNTYVVGPTHGGPVAVVDPGPPLRSHRMAIESAVRRRDGRIALVVVTHHHADHAGAVGWASGWDVGVRAFDPARVDGAQHLGDGDTVDVDGVRLVVHHHPGHSSDHLCLQILDTGVVLTGDHVLGEGTTVIAWPDGDLAEHLASLRALRHLRPAALYPGHGDVVGDPINRIDALLAHRAQRTRQIVEALGRGCDTVEAVVSQVYGDLPDQVRRAAARSVTAHLADLEARGLAVHLEGRWHGA